MSCSGAANQIKHATQPARIRDDAWAGWLKEIAMAKAKKRAAARKTSAKRAKPARKKSSSKKTSSKKASSKKTSSKKTTKRATANKAKSKVRRAAKRVTKPAAEEVVLLPQM